MTKTEEHKERYLIAAHAVQTGTAMMMGYNRSQGTKKYMHTGLNSVLSNLSGLAAILIVKGIITEEEYFKSLADAMEQEKLRLTEEIADHLENASGKRPTIELH